MSGASPPGDDGGDESIHPLGDDGGDSVKVVEIVDCDMREREEELVSETKAKKGLDSIGRRLKPFNKVNVDHHLV